MFGEDNVALPESRNKLIFVWTLSQKLRLAPSCYTKGPLSIGMFTRVTGVVLSLSLILSVGVLSSTAKANFEQVETFGQQGSPGEFGEDVTGITVDETNNNVYISNGANHGVLHFSGNVSLLEGWGWGVGDGTPKFERCGSEGEPGYQTCTKGLSGEGVGQFIKPQGIAVDQATHNVYVLDSDRQTNVVQVFSPDGK